MQFKQLFQRSRKSQAARDIATRLKYQRFLKWVVYPILILSVVGLGIFLAVWFTRPSQGSSSTSQEETWFVPTPFKYKIAILFLAFPANQGAELKLYQNLTFYTTVPKQSETWMQQQTFGQLSFSGIVNSTASADVFGWLNLTGMNPDECGRYREWASEAQVRWNVLNGGKSTVDFNAYDMLVLVTSKKCESVVIPPTPSSPIAVVHYASMISPLLFGKLAAFRANLDAQYGYSLSLSCLDYSNNQAVIPSSDNCNVVYNIDCLDILKTGGCPEMISNPTSTYIQPLARERIGWIPAGWIKTLDLSQGTQQMTLHSVQSSLIPPTQHYVLLKVKMNNRLASEQLAVNKLRFLYVENKNGTVLFRMTPDVLANKTEMLAPFLLGVNLTTLGDSYYDASQDIKFTLSRRQGTTVSLLIEPYYSDTDKYLTELSARGNLNRKKTLKYAIFPVDFADGKSKHGADDPVAFFNRLWEYSWKPVLNRASGGLFRSTGHTDPNSPFDVFPWISNVITADICQSPDQDTVIWNFMYDLSRQYVSLYNNEYFPQGKPWLDTKNYDVILVTFPGGCSTNKLYGGLGTVRTGINDKGLVSMTSVDYLAYTDPDNIDLGYSFIGLHESYGHTLGFKHTLRLDCNSTSSFLAGCQGRISTDSMMFMDYGNNRDNAKRLRKATPFDREMQGWLYPPFLKTIKKSSTFSLVDYDDAGQYQVGNIYALKYVLKNPTTYTTLDGSPGSSTLSQLYIQSIEKQIYLFVSAPVGFARYTAVFRVLNQTSPVYSNQDEGLVVKYVGVNNDKVNVEIQITQ